MKKSLIRGMACFLVLALTALFGVGCGGGGEGGKVTIVVGEIIDLTGPGSPAVKSFHYATQDLASYYNDRGLIPGAKIKLVTWDNQFNVARELPGYDWCKQQGAKVIFGVHQTTPETLKPFAERDKMPVFTGTFTEAGAEPPGWVFIMGANVAKQEATILKWVSENDWDYNQGVPKIGFFGWSEVGGIGVEKAVKEYCRAHPDEFNYVGGYFSPMGSSMFSGEIEKLKDCDYVYPYGYPAGQFIHDFRTKGYTAKFIGDTCQSAFSGFFVDLCGWDTLDGYLTLNLARWWNESSPLVDLAKELLSKYRSGEAESIIHAGAGYVGGMSNLLAFYEILRQTVQEVGAENFSGQAMYDTAVNFKLNAESTPLWNGMSEWSFSDTDRSCVHDVAVYKWSAQDQDLVRVSDWLPLG